MNFELVVFIGIVIFVFGYFIVFKFAPVDTKNKPIKPKRRKTHEKRIFKDFNYIFIY